MNGILLSGSERLSRWVTVIGYMGLIGSMGAFGVSLVGTKFEGDFTHAYQWFPLAIACSVVFFIGVVDKIDKNCDVRVNSRTSSMYHVMGYYKVLFLTAAYFLMYRFVMFSIFGVGFMDFTPEKMLFDSSGRTGLIHAESSRFLTAGYESHKNMFIGMYATLALHFFGGIGGYYWLKTKADAFSRESTHGMRKV